jgi:hypothetical protein
VHMRPRLMRGTLFFLQFYVPFALPIAKKLFQQIYFLFPPARQTARPRSREEKLFQSKLLSVHCQSTCNPTNKLKNGEHSNNEDVK